MAKFEETATTLHVALGMPKFNGCVAVFDKHKGTVSIARTDLFFKSKPVEVPLSEIDVIHLVKVKSSAYPRIVLKSGRKLDMPSFAADDAEQAVPRMIKFLATP